MPSTDYNRIKLWLLPILDSKGMSVESFARLVGISRATVYFYLSDKHRPDEQVMAQICRVLGVPFEEGLRQYTPKKWGRPRGRSRVKEVTVY
jgi:transcriptional regulator with XRE-family HTH domain